MSDEVRTNASAVLLVAALLTSSALVFIFAALGLRGNGAVTGGYLLFTVAGALLLGREKEKTFSMMPMDWAFAAAAIAIFAASALHFEKRDFNEYVVLGGTIFAYLSGRFLSDSVIKIIQIRLLQISTPLVAVGSIATIPYLIGEAYAKPRVFGFDHAATVFCVAFGYMVIAFTYSTIAWRSKLTLLLFALSTLATVVFVASTVRFALIAIVITALFSLACSIYKPVSIKKRIAVVLLAILIGTIAGTASRYAFVTKIKDFVTNSGALSGIGDPDSNVVFPRDFTASDPPGFANFHPIEDLPSCQQRFNLNNSVAVRRALLNDAIYFLPKAGFFGFGLNSFSRMSCFRGYQIHNAILQAIVEFGWIAGIALIILMVYPLWQFLFYRGGADLNFQFLLAGVGFETLLSLVYGQVSRELSLFLFLGCFANVVANGTVVEGGRDAPAVAPETATN